MVNWSIALGGILAALLSFMFSAILPAPFLRSLRQQQIAQRNFSTRIDIHSNDELQELAERFNTIATELALYHRQQKQWLTDISHELKTPLTLLVGKFLHLR